MGEVNGGNQPGGVGIDNEVMTVAKKIREYSEIWSGRGNFELIVVNEITEMPLMAWILMYIHEVAVHRGLTVALIWREKLMQWN